MDINQSIEEFQKLVSNVQPGFVNDFLLWIKGNTIDEIIEEANGNKRKNDDIIIDSIREDLRQNLPVNALSPTENILVPVVGCNKDCTPDTTVHVDAFLYDEDGIDEMCEKGLMSRNYCVNCGSKMVKPLTFITHSASVKQIKYIYQILLPDLRGKTILDVGSRTGAILYGAHVYSTASRIIGVEINENFYHLQNNIIQKYGFTDRIQIYHKDVMDCEKLLQESDVIILNNVFEFFMQKHLQESVWNFLHKILKKDTILLTIPSIEESIEPLQTEVNIEKWVKPMDTDDLRHRANLLYYGSVDSDESDLDNIHMYQIL